MKTIMGKLRKFDQYSILAVFLLLILAGMIFNCFFVILANIFLLFSLLISWIFFNITRVAKLTNILYLVYLMVCILLYSCFVGNTKSWLIFLILIIIETGVFCYLSRVYSQIITKITKQLAQSVIVGFALIGLLPLVHFLAIKIVENRIDHDAKVSVQTVRSFLDEKENLSVEKANSISSDQSLISLVESKDYQALGSYCQNLMVGQNLNYLTITDSKGMVLVRAHFPEAVGDRLSTADLILTDNSSAAKGIASDFPGKFYLYGATPLKNSQNVVIGEVVAGYSIDDRLTREIASTKDMSLSFHTESDRVAKYSFDKNILNFIGRIDHTKLADNPKATIYQTDNDEIFGILSQKIDYVTSAQEKPDLWVLAVADKQYEEQIIILSEKAFWLLTLIITFGLIFYEKIRFPRKRSVNNFIHFFYNPKDLFDSVLRLALVVVAVSYLIASAAILSSKALNKQLKIAELPAENEIFLTENKPTLYLDSTKRTYNISENVPVSVFFESKNKEIYSADVRLKYPADKLGFSSISFEKSACSEVFNQNVDEKNGWAEFSCQIKSESKNGLLSTIYLTPLDDAMPTISLDSAYSFLLGDQGKDTTIKNTFWDGENFIITK